MVVRPLLVSTSTRSTFPSSVPCTETSARSQPMMLSLPETFDISTMPRASAATVLSKLRPSALAAALAVGMWLGRTIFPIGSTQPQPPVATNNTQELATPVAYVTDPRYIKQRTELVRTLEAKMKALPPETQQKVAASLETIRKSITDIQAALGRDPGNALLQELLVNSYQDEMRVLTAVHEAGDSGREI